LKTLIIYDSVYGNTEKIARAIGDVISGDIKVLSISEAGNPELKSNDLLIICSPTRGGRPTPAVQDFIQKLSESDVKGKKVAAFDTRSSVFFVGIFGYAAERIAKNLNNKGGKLVLPPEGFFVKGREGPLKEGEIERAAGWARKVIDHL
jgi:flavodoxin I